MIHKAKTVMILNEGTKLQILESHIKVFNFLIDVHRENNKNQGNYIYLYQVYFFGLFKRMVCLNSKRILYFFPK